MDLPYEATCDHEVYRPRLTVSNRDMVKAFCALSQLGEHEAADKILPSRVKSAIAPMLAVVACDSEGEISILEMYNNLIADLDSEEAE